MNKYSTRTILLHKPDFTKTSREPHKKIRCSDRSNTTNNIIYCEKLFIMTNLEPSNKGYITT